MPVSEENRLANPRGPTLACLLALLAAAGILFWRSPFQASHLGITPDSVEYATAGYRLAHGQGCGLEIEGKGLPSRYPPWFSVFAAAPAYRLLGDEPGNPVVSVLLLSLLGVAAAWGVGLRAAGMPGAVVSAGMVMALPLYRLYAGEIMTDAPGAALMLACLFLYLRARAQPGDRTGWEWPAAGLALALATAFRAPLAALAVPFAIFGLRSPGAARWKRLSCLAIPLAALFVANAFYNRAVFGSASRTGYNFWCGVPFDYPHLAFSAAFVPANLRAAQAAWLLFPGLVAVAALVFLVRRERAAAPDRERPLAGIGAFGLLSLLPLFALHLFYFFPDPRLFLPIQVWVAVAAAACLSVPLRIVRPSAAVAAAAAVLLAAGLFRMHESREVPWRRLGADRIRLRTPADAVVLSGLDPVYLNLVLGPDNRRRVVPLSREVEFASKVITPMKVVAPDPYPVSAWDHRCRGLLAGGAQEAVAVVVAEQSDLVRRWLKEGKAVYLDLTSLQPADREVIHRLETEFTLQEVEPGLHLIRPR
ncbi:MAG: glycosyltransferase family 39 protein [Planctomycetes bacterium]|nr:glycosyltransferase family 39 protein [Planctomycetota bacterium]